MARYASNKHALGISDRSGAAYRLHDMRKEWTGMLVGKDEWEAKQPQLTPIKAPADPQSLRDPRPDRTEPAVEVCYLLTLLLPRLADLRLSRFLNPVMVVLQGMLLGLGKFKASTVLQNQLLNLPLDIP